MTEQEWKTLRNNLASSPRNRSFADVERALKAAGFIPKPAKTGSHVTFKKPDYPQIVTIPIPKRGGLLIAYTKKAIHAIDDSTNEQADE